MRSPDLFPRRAGRAVLFVAVLALAAGGCGKKTGTVSGKVFYQDKTLPGGTVNFQAEGANSALKTSQIGEDDGGPASASTNRLFRQLPGGRFEDASKGAGLALAGHNMGAAVGDIDNDGRPDLLVTQYGGLKLFHNEGRGVFSDITHAAGLDSVLWGASAAFFDYDRDGWLDLVVPRSHLEPPG